MSATNTMLTSVHYKHNAHLCPLQAQCPVQAQCSPVSTTSTMHQCRLQARAQCSPCQCRLQAQCSPMSTTSTMLTSVHGFSARTLASNSALGTGPSVVSTALREVQVGGLPLHCPLFHILRALRPQEMAECHTDA